MNQRHEEHPGRPESEHGSSEDYRSRSAYDPRREGGYGSVQYGQAYGQGQRTPGQYERPSHSERDDPSQPRYAEEGYGQDPYRQGTSWGRGDGDWPPQADRGSR